MRRLLTLTLLPLLVLSVFAVAPAEATTAGKRATWVWTRPAPKTLVSWASKQKVAELFVYVAPGFASTSDRSWVASVVSQAHAAGIKVAALGGDPSWIDDPSAGVAWAQEAVATGLFDGIHVDVEPWVRADWSTRRDAVVAEYLDLLRRLDDATTLRLEADIAFWLWEVPIADGSALDRALMGIVDAVTVMSYRNLATGPNSITDIGAHELETASSAGIPCRLAVETGYLGSDAVSRMQTFYGLGARTLTTALAKVDSVEAGLTSYAGIAVHDYTGWRAM